MALLPLTILCQEVLKKLHFTATLDFIVTDLQINADEFTVNSDTLRHWKLQLRLHYVLQFFPGTVWK